MKNRYLTNYIVIITLTLSCIIVISKLIIGAYDDSLVLPILFLSFFLIGTVLLMLDIYKSKKLKTSLYRVHSVREKHPNPGKYFFTVLFTILMALALLILVLTDETAGFLFIYYLTLNSFTTGNLSKGFIHEMGLNFKGQNYTWDKVSGVILNRDDSMEIRIKGSKEPLKMYYDIEQRSDISNFLSTKFNENLFIDTSLEA